MYYISYKDKARKLTCVNRFTRLTRHPLCILIMSIIFFHNLLLSIFTIKKTQKEIAKNSVVITKIEKGKNCFYKYLKNYANGKN